MLQRIQSVYILLSIVLLGLLFRLPIAELTSRGEIFSFTVFGIFRGNEKTIDGILLVCFTLAILLLHLIVLFSYKKRIRQIRILVFTMVLLAGLFGLFFWYTRILIPDAMVSFKITTVFPVVALILDYLAIRGIGKDEALIRSLNRIR
jgi:hypothetical protein